MSTINSLASALGTTSSNSSSGTNSASAATQLTANDFIQFMVTQLQNQDPLDPTDSNQMLTQMSQIGQLESSTSLQTSLTGMVQQNQVAAASAMIGKEVNGTDQFSNAVSGVVSAVQVTSNGVQLSLDSGSTVSMNNVTSITDAPSTTTGTTSTTTQ
jgi:flagellar basal-body rod modification protein FlgD